MDAWEIAGVSARVAACEDWTVALQLPRRAMIVSDNVGIFVQYAVFFPELV